MLRIFTALFLLAGAAQIGSAAEDEKESRKIAGWGAVVDPDGDCTVTETGRVVTFQTPKRHNLWYGDKIAAKRFNAPRVVQTLKGDFTVQVKVTADWESAADSTDKKYYYFAAGLVVWDSPKQYMRWERNVYCIPKGKATCYSGPMYDRDNKRVESAKPVLADFFKGQSSWLRIVRAGQKLTTYVSHNGKRWIKTGIRRTEFPDEVQVGVHTINGSSNTELVVKFSDFAVRNFAEKEIEKEPRKIAGWGVAVDPDGDCTITQKGGQVAIKTPDSLHDLWAARKDEQTRFNAPRVWQEVTGDFVAQVRVTGDWKPAVPPSRAKEWWYVGAGLVVWDSGKQYIRLERNLINHPTLGRICYTTPMQDQEGKRINAWKTGKADFFKGSSTWLRVERAREKLTTSVSHDGEEWIETAVLTTELPRKVRAGILVINCSTGEFAATFDQFKLTAK